jgi:predicted DCC family thiol-disulfide oxidoreductase YuxK
MRVLPGWRLLAPVLSVWPFKSLGAVFYRWLAARRYKLFGVPPPGDPSGVCSLHAPK